MNVQVLIGASDITNKVISYDRDAFICTGVGTISIKTTLAGASGVSPWDKITLYEEGHKKGEYFVVSIEEDVRDGSAVIEGQDGSLKLQAYFVAEQYNITSYQTAGPWIEKFANEAGISVSFVSGSAGSPLGNNSQLGMANAYDLIMTLLQQSGWYMYFNTSNTMIVGNIVTGYGNAGSINETRILTSHTNKNDKMLRNRAVVWGHGTGDEWVFADLYQSVPWTTGSGDIRTMVLANSYIYDIEDAYRIARDMLSEFARLTYEKHYEITGELDAKIGNRLFVTSRDFTGRGIITTIGSSASASGGLKTIVILDQRCPRLFGFYGVLDIDEVFVGTSGKGVWKKQLGGYSWTEFNDGGFASQYVADLYINAGVYLATTNSGVAHARTDVQGWMPVTLTGVYDENGTFYGPSGVYATACAIDKLTNDLYVAYNKRGNGVPPGMYADLPGSGIIDYSNPRSWMVKFTPYTREQVEAHQIVIVESGLAPEYGYAVYDFDNNTLNNIITVIESGYLPGTAIDGYLKKDEQMEYRWWDNPGNFASADAFDFSTLTYLPTPASGVRYEKDVDYDSISSSGLGGAIDLVHGHYVVQGNSARIRRLWYVGKIGEGWWENDTLYLSAIDTEYETDGYTRTYVNRIVHMGGDIYRLYYSRAVSGLSVRLVDVNILTGEHSHVGDFEELWTTTLGTPQWTNGAGGWHEGCRWQERVSHYSNSVNGSEADSCQFEYIFVNVALGKIDKVTYQDTSDAGGIGQNHVYYVIHDGYASPAPDNTSVIYPGGVYFPQVYRLRVDATNNHWDMKWWHGNYNTKTGTATSRLEWIDRANNVTIYHVAADSQDVSNGKAFLFDVNKNHTRSVVRVQWCYGWGENPPGDVKRTVKVALVTLPEFSVSYSHSTEGAAGWPTLGSQANDAYLDLGVTAQEQTYCYGQIVTRDIPTVYRLDVQYPNHRTTNKPDIREYAENSLTWTLSGWNTEQVPGGLEFVRSKSNIPTPSIISGPDWVSNEIYCLVVSGGFNELWNIEAGGDFGTKQLKTVSDSYYTASLGGLNGFFGLLYGSTYAMYYVFSGLPNAGGSIVLRQNRDEQTEELGERFTVVFEPTVHYKVDNSQDTVTVLHQGILSGYPNVNEAYHSFTNEPNSFSGLLNEYPINDLRTFQVADPGNFDFQVSASGYSQVPYTATSGMVLLGLVATSGALNALPISGVNDWGSIPSGYGNPTLAIFSGYSPVNVEASRFGNPYLFASINGITTDLFYERAPDESTFTLYPPTTLSGVHITTIRMDDTL